MYWIVLIGGLCFILFQIFFGGGQKSKFKSDLPNKESKPFYKTKKGVVIFCLASLLTIFSVYLILSLVI